MAPQTIVGLPRAALPRTDDRHPLLAPLLQTEHEHTIHAQLLGLRAALLSPTTSDVELVELVEAISMHATSVDQEVVLSAAAQPHSGERGQRHAIITEKRIASGEPAGDETMTPTMLVPLLRRASRLACTDAELGERLLDAVGTLTASLAGHGEHTYRIGLGGSTGSLSIRHLPSGQCAGARFSPVALLGLGAVAAGWAGLRVEGRAVLELGCGTGAVGIACATLGAKEVWCTDIDADALALAARNAAINGAACSAVRVARLDMHGTERTDAPADVPLTRRFGLVVAANVVHGGDDAPAVVAAAARRLDLADPVARVLCCLGLAHRSANGGRRAIEGYEASVRIGESVFDSSLRIVASEVVAADAQSEALLLLLLAPATAAARREAPRRPLEGGAGPAPSDDDGDGDARRRLCEVDVSAAPAGWTATAAAALVQDGACVLRRCSAAIPAEVVERCRCDARPRLDRLLRLAAAASARARACGGDADGGGGGGECGGDTPLRFQQLWSRAPWERRFDVTVLNGGGRNMEASTVAPLQSSGVDASSPMPPPPSSSSVAPWRALLACIDALVRPVLTASGLFGEARGDADADKLCVEAVGFVLSLPGAPGQVWHPDSEAQVGLVNVFVPLVPLSDANGPTAVALGSHGGGGAARPSCPRVVRPLLDAGEVLLFDWRTWHRGCANTSADDRPVACVTYARRGVEGASYKRAMPTLEAWGT